MCRCALVLVSCLAAASGLAADFTATLDQLAQPTLAGDAHAVEDFSFVYGNARFTISGEAESILAAEQRVGFVFAGTGSVKLTIQDGPFQQANLTTLSDKLKWKGGSVYHQSFTSAAFFTRRLPDQLLSGEARTVVHLAEVLERSVTRWAEVPNTGLDHFLADELFNLTPIDSTLALLWGDEDTVYHLDGSDIANESFARWDRFSPGGLKYFPYPDVLIAQPVAFDQKQRPQPAVLQTDVDLEVVSRDNLFMTEKTTTELTAGLDGVRLVTFGLLNGRSEKWKLWNEHDDPFKVTSIKTSQGLTLEHSHKYDELKVLLPRTLMAGETISLVIEAEGNFLKNYAGDAYLVLGNMAYFPQMGIHSMRAPFHSVVKVKDPYIPLGCGVNLRRWQEEGGLNCLETREEKPMAFPFLVVGKFEKAEEQKEGYSLKVYSYAMAKRRGAENLLRNGLAVLDFYSNGMAPFPYKELEVVEIPYYRHFFWQAPAGLVEITSEGLDPLGGDSSDLDTLIKRYARKGQNARYAHEIAHQWFGNLVSWATPYDNWLSESFSEYLSFLFMAEGAKDPKKAKIQLREWQIDAEECSEKSSIYGADSLGGSPSTRSCYTQLLYGKGPYVLHALRQEIGDETFKKMFYFITTQAAKKEDMKIITEDVILFVNALTGKDYHDWFDRYIFGTEIPPVKMKL